jgi:hypothetical protein
LRRPNTVTMWLDLPKSVDEDGDAGQAEACQGLVMFMRVLYGPAPRRPTVRPEDVRCVAT